MFNILLTGVGGQGTVLAAKVLAMAAAAKGWKVRTAETIGMAQRGGSVTSHVRMGNNGEDVLAPLITHGTADVIIAFEPGEAARNLSYLSRNGVVITAATTVEPVSASLASMQYTSKDILEKIELTLYNDMAKGLVQKLQPPRRRRLIPIDDMAVTDALGGNRKVLNSVLLAAAVAQNCLPITIEELRNAVSACVKPQFVNMNVNAIDTVVRGMK